MSDAGGTYFLPGFGYVPFSGFWGPIGDIYPLTPVWSEHHAPQGFGVDSAAEQDLVQNLLVPFGLDYTFTIDLTDTSATPLVTTDDLPAGDVTSLYQFSRVTSAVTAPFGWAQTKSLTITPSGGTGDAWDGTLICTVPAALQSFIGFDRSCPFRITLYMANRQTSIEYRVDVMFGEIAVRA